MNKYNIIGDIHGRRNWKKLIIDDGVNIFVGDYFSPYHAEITWESQKENFLDIINYKIKHPETILLIGNHDCDHWCWDNETCSRHDYKHEKEIAKLFEDNKHLFQAAYSINNEYLVTHAGLSIYWLFKQLYKKNNIHFIDLYLDMFFECKTIKDALKKHYQMTSLNRDIDFDEVINYNQYDLLRWKNVWYYWNGSDWTEYKTTPNECANFINDLFLTDNKKFSFSENADFHDYYGYSPQHSPMWIRVGNKPWEGLFSTNIFSGTKYKQIFGHTISHDIIKYNDKICDNDIKTGQMFMVDCLEYLDKSLIIEL